MSLISKYDWISNLLFSARCFGGPQTLTSTIYIDYILYTSEKLCRDGARNLPTGADSFGERAKIWCAGYYKCQKSPKNRFPPSDGGLACSNSEAIAS